MSSKAPVFIQSRDNALIKNLHKIKNEPKSYRKIGLIFVEGEHLCQSLLDFQQQYHSAQNPHDFNELKIHIEYAVFSQSQYLQNALSLACASAAARVAVVADGLWADISDLPSPAGVGLVLRWPLGGDGVVEGDALQGFAPQAASVVLDGVQDAGNVGTMLRTAAAMGFGQIVALPGTAALFAPKVLRAAQGAHWGLRLFEGATAERAFVRLSVPLLATSPHAAEWVHRADLPWPCAWIFGHEGRGVRDAVFARASRTLAIAQPGGQESLNVAAAAAICLHASATTAMNKII